MANNCEYPYLLNFAVAKTLWFK